MPEDHNELFFYEDGSDLPQSSLEIFEEDPPDDDEDDSVEDDLLEDELF